MLHALSLAELEDDDDEDDDRWAYRLRGLVPNQRSILQEHQSVRLRSLLGNIPSTIDSAVPRSGNNDFRSLNLCLKQASLMALVLMWRL